MQVSEYGMWWVFGLRFYTGFRIHTVWSLVRFSGFQSCTAFGDKAGAHLGLQGDVRDALCRGSVIWCSILGV